MRKLAFIVFWVIAFIVANFFFGDQILALLIKNEVLVDHETELISQLDKEELQSASSYDQYLFPYDFIEGAPPNWTTLKVKKLNGMPLTWTELQQYEFYEQCYNIGLDLNSYNNSVYFLVDVKAVAGINLKDKEWLVVDNALKQITITLPPAEILSLQILNKSALSEEGWPSIAVTPEVWGKLMTFLKPQIEAKVYKTNLLSMATKNAQVVLEKSLNLQNEYQFKFIEQDQGVTAHAEN